MPNPILHTMQTIHCTEQIRPLGTARWGLRSKKKPSSHPPKSQSPAGGGIECKIRNMICCRVQGPGTPFGLGGTLIVPLCGGGGAKKTTESLGIGYGTNHWAWAIEIKPTRAESMNNDTCLKYGLFHLFQPVSKNIRYRTICCIIPSQWSHLKN